MKKRILILLYALCVLLPSGAVTQQGYVKTIARKGKAGAPVEGAVIRVRGSHNAVESREEGDFSILLASLQNGEPYTIASIYKSGYEPAEQGLVGRKLPCSSLVPLEVLLVNSAELREEKEAIANKARENIESYYQSQYSALEKQLAEAKLNEADFARRVQELENKYERFEPLLQSMSDYFARTDYDRLDSLSLLIQDAIEQGNPDEAERLIRLKGSMEEREAAIREEETRLAKAQQTLQEAQRQLDRQSEQVAKDKRALADDYFRLYAAFVSRFANDSAALYIRKRAELDTLNADYQIEAGQFMKDIMADYGSARAYFERAYRLSQQQYGEWSGAMATTCHEIGAVCKVQQEYDKALEWYERSLLIREKIRGKNTPAVAETLNNLGELYRAQKDYKQAMKMHRQALEIREKAFGKESLQAAESKNNIAGLYANEQQWAKAEQLYREIAATYASNAKTPARRLADNAINRAVVAYRLGRYEEALTHAQRAHEMYSKVLGESHPQTRTALAIRQQIQQSIQQ